MAKYVVMTLLIRPPSPVLDRSIRVKGEAVFSLRDFDMVRCVVGRDLVEYLSHRPSRSRFILSAWAIDRYLTSTATTRVTVKRNVGTRRSLNLRLLISVGKLGGCCTEVPVPYRDNCGDCTA